MVIGNSYNYINCGQPALAFWDILTTIQVRERADYYLLLPATAYRGGQGPNPRPNQNTLG